MPIKKLSVKELEKMYRTKTNRVICLELGINQKTLVRYLMLNNIPLKGSGNNPKLIITQD